MPLETAHGLYPAPLVLPRMHARCHSSQYNFETKFFSYMLMASGTAWTHCCTGAATSRGASTRTTYGNLGKLPPAVAAILGGPALPRPSVHVITGCAGSGAGAPGRPSAGMLGASVVLNNLNSLVQLSRRRGRQALLRRPRSRAKEMLICFLDDWVRVQPQGARRAFPATRTAACGFARSGPANQARWARALPSRGLPSPSQTAVKP